MSNGVVVDDIVKDVDENGSDFGVVGDEFESFFDGGGGSIIIDVEEVGGLVVIEFDDIYGGYGKVGVVDKVVDVIVEFDEVEIGFGGVYFIGVFLGGVVLFEGFFLVEFGVVVKVEFGVYVYDFVVWSFGEGVDFDLGGVFFEEDFVEVLDGFDGIVNVLFVEVEFDGDVVGYFVCYIDVDVDVGGVDSIGVFFGDIFNVYVVLWWGYDDGVLGVMVYEDGEVEFVVGEFVFVDVDGVVEMVLSIGLFGDEFVIDYLFGEYFGFGGGVDDMNIVF